MFIVETYTFCEGWVNCWTVDDKPSTFATREAAQAEIDEVLNDTERDLEDAYSPEDFRIVAVQQ